MFKKSILFVLRKLAQLLERKLNKKWKTISLFRNLRCCIWTPPHYISLNGSRKCVLKWCTNEKTFNVCLKSSFLNKVMHFQNLFVCTLVSSLWDNLSQLCTWQWMVTIIFILNFNSVQTLKSETWKIKIYKIETWLHLFF